MNNFKMAKADNRSIYGPAKQSIKAQAVYSALAKTYIHSNDEPEKSLKENDQYDPLIVGKYCERPWKTGLSISSHETTSSCQIEKTS